MNTLDWNFRLSLGGTAASVCGKKVCDSGCMTARSGQTFVPLFETARAERGESMIRCTDR